MLHFQVYKEDVYVCILGSLCMLRSCLIYLSLYKLCKNYLRVEQDFLTELGIVTPIAVFTTLLGRNVFYR